ncbi:MAG: acyl-CoA thioesterase [Actinobacteria bacterium]|nr:acyl-CoA thioesterase [Actinomycetota bacterium]
MGIEQVERRRVAWIDTDAGGRIHFTAAFRYAEAAETELMRSVGLLGGEWADYPRRRVEAEYRQVLVFDDEVEVRLRVERLGTTSVTYAWEITRAGALCIEGRHTVVHVDREGRPSPLPARVRSALGVEPRPE